MPRHLVLTQKRIINLQKEGRGSGEGASYKPWIQVDDFPSQGRCHCIQDIFTGRVHDCIWEIIEKFVLDPEMCFDAEKRNIFIKDTVGKTGHSRSTIQRWLQRYCAGGSTKMALFPDLLSAEVLVQSGMKRRRLGIPEHIIQGFKDCESEKSKADL